MNAEIICVGSEILLGDIVNTNAVFLSKGLAELGINVHYQTVVGDNEQRLIDALKIAYSRSDIVVTTGGLGPTKDDITKEAVAKFFQKELIYNEDIYNTIKNYLKKKYNKDTISPSNRKQAYVPDGAITIENSVGTAPGIFLTDKNKTALLLPGPPKEAEHVFTLASERHLKRLSSSTILSANLILKGIGESIAADEISSYLDLKNPTVAPYAKEDCVVIRITASGESKETCISAIQPVANEICEILKPYIHSIKFPS